MKKTIKITREALYSTSRKPFEVKNKGTKPKMRDQEALIALIKAMKQN